jgi:outer membrane protein
MFSRGASFGAAFIMLSTAVAAPAKAEGAESLSIAQALVFAYTSNPGLQAERARQRATDEAVPQALSGWRPTISANADIGVGWAGSVRAGGKDSQPAGAAITLSQPIFRGFRTVAATARAEALVNSGRENLLAVEQQVLLDAATAYMNVIRDRNVLELREKNVSALNKQLTAAQERLKVGENTHTDVSQARARLALSESARARAKADLSASLAFYARVIGRSAGKLAFPRLSRRTPKSLDEALAMADRINPHILAVAFNEEAARHNIQLVEGELLPEISVNAQYGYNNRTDTNFDWSDQGVVYAQVTVPIYDGGLTYSRVRQAKQIANQRSLEILDVRRQVRQQVTEAWSLLGAASSTIASSRVQVQANRTALEGVQQEALVGTRTVLDVLDAEQELVDSEVLLATAERDRIIAAYQLIASVGRMTARDLGLDVLPYDPGQNYSDTRGKLWGTEVKTVP